MNSSHRRRRLWWVLGTVGGVLALAAVAGMAWWSHVTEQAQATALAGLQWQATLGIRPYVPGAGGLVPIGSQADLLARYLSLMDGQTESEEHLVPVGVHLLDVVVLDQDIGWQGGWVEYGVHTDRTLRKGSALESSTTQGRVTIWVSPGSSRPFQVTAVAYDFDPVQSLAGPDSLSYLAQLMTPQAATPLGFPP